MTSAHIPTEPGSGPRPHYAALNVPAFAGSMAVLLVVRKGRLPEERLVLAIGEGEARQLHADGRLTGWTPFPDETRPGRAASKEVPESPA